MGLMIDGVWHKQWYDTSATGGRFVRKDSIYRNWVTSDGTAGPSGHAGFAAEAGRYHLYVSLACPWAHRTLIMRALKGLDAMVSVSVVNWLMLEEGWTFADGPGVIPDPINGAHFLREIYSADDRNYTGSVTVPILWDRQAGKIVNNESSEILRMLGSAFDGVGARPGDYYPQPLRAEIDALNQRIYDTVNNGVYRAGFATSQQAYAEAFESLFETLDWLEERLSSKANGISDCQICSFAGATSSKSPSSFSIGKVCCSLSAVAVRRSPRSLRPAPVPRPIPACAP